MIFCLIILKSDDLLLKKEEEMLHVDLEVNLLKETRHTVSKTQKIPVLTHGLSAFGMDFFLHAYLDNVSNVRVKVH